MKDKGKKRKLGDDEENRHHTIAQAGSGSSTLLPPPPPSTSRSPDYRFPTKDKGKKPKLDDLPYQDQHDIIAQRLVQQVTCSTMPVKIIILMSSCRRGHMLYELMGQS